MKMPFIYYVSLRNGSRVLNFWPSPSSILSNSTMKDFLFLLLLPPSHEESQGRLFHPENTLKGTISLLGLGLLHAEGNKSLSD